MTEFETGDYVDLVGRKWFCVADRKKKQMVCNSYDGYFTVASFTTFPVWGWKSAVPPAHGTKARTAFREGASDDKN